MFNKFCTISHSILQAALSGAPKIEFLKNLLKTLIDNIKCDSIELRIKQDKFFYLCIIKSKPKTNYHFETLNCLYKNKQNYIPCNYDEEGLEIICSGIMKKNIRFASPHFTKKGSFYTNDISKPIPIDVYKGREKGIKNIKINGPNQSLAFFNFQISGDNNGILIIKSEKKDFFTIKDIYFYESLCKILGDALIHQQAQATLRERVKEISCLYEIGQIVKKPEISLENIFADIVNILPNAWQYPNLASARIIIDEKEFCSINFKDNDIKLRSNIILRGEKRGLVEVIYKSNPEETKGNPFLLEEQNLIDTVSQQITLIIERKQAEKERLKLQDQLRHADRLATIGQLSAGVAHELNEPLSNILGFAQLSIKTPDIPLQVKTDLNYIINASLHAREIIKKLMIFGRQMPPQKLKVNINKLIKEGLFFLESRCAKSGIQLKKSLGEDMPFIIADPSQIHQILVNLIVNAVHAMPDGGKLTVQTRKKNGYIEIKIKDTGTGMDEQTLKQIFIPFFTTKDINEGTGLGLAVVHGIVKAHNGYINVDSKPDKGSVFTVLLPIDDTEKQNEE